jgi:predicted AAA+ superfamily ATPase
MITRKLQLSKYIDKNQSVFVFGPRGAGKTKLLDMSLPKSAMRISLLEGQDYQRYLTEPSRLSQEVRARIKNKKGKDSLVIAIDEIQKLPALLDAVHLLIEEFKSRICFVLTGSSARKLKRSGANLLAGRALTTYLHPISILEDELELNTTLRLGSLPAVYLELEFAEERLISYMSTYLKEEILEESLVRKIDRFARFLDLAGQLNAEPINHSKIAKNLKTTSNTVLEYFSILVDTLICHRIDGWSQSIKRQLLQAPKYYWFDCGVLNAINGELRTEVKSSSFRYGKLFETYLVQEIIRFNDYLSLQFRLNYWRDKNGKEVDIILSRSLSKPLAAIEIKSSTSPTEDDLSGLLSFKEDYPKVPCYCFSNTPRPYQLSFGIDVLPWRDGLNLLSQL